MNIISVEHLPPLAVVSKGRTNAPTKNVISKQARCVPPLVIVSNGKAVTSTAVVKDRVPQLTIISKGKVVANNGALEKQLCEVECSSPLAVVQTSKSINPNLGKPSFPPQLAVAQRKINPNSGQKLNTKGKTVKPTINLLPKKPLIVKTYANVSAPAPLFGPFKSKIPLASRQDGKLQIVDLSTKTEWTPQKSSIVFDRVNDIEWNSMGASNVSQIYESVTNDATIIEDPSVDIMKTADKAVQTECFCQCYSRGSSDSGTRKILEVVQKISSELKEFKLNITGKRATKLMDGIFPIKSEANLMKIQYNMENTENFDLRLKLHLKYLKPKSSTTINTTVFQQLISDDFLKGKNWDGGNKFEAIDKYSFFQTTLFEAWQHSGFTKDIYIAAMRHEIGKSHDRERKRNKTN